MARAKLSCTPIISAAPPLRFIAIRLLAFFLLGFVQSLQAAPDPQKNPWRTAASPVSGALAAQVWVQPDKATAFDLDHSLLRGILSQVTGQAPSNTIAIPLPDGSIPNFRFVEAPVMAPELAAKFPEIRTFSGSSLENPAATVRFDITSVGFHAQIILPEGAAYVEPYLRGNTNLHVCYFKRDYRAAARGFECFTTGETSKAAGNGTATAAFSSLDGNLRTYRLACAATGEYTAYQGGTVAAGMAGIVTAINRVTGIYESELGIRLVLVGNNNLIVYTNSAADPYTDGNPSLLLSQNQSNLDAVIGNVNYDIGHVFGTGGGGLAGVGVVCVSGLKAYGETGVYPPTGDGFWVDYVAHEMGHQFGATHTFNATNSGCGGNRTASSAYEPGSGSTIMAYAGVCGLDNLQYHSSPYFHSISFEQVMNYVTGGGGSGGGSTTYTGNHVPAVLAGTDFTIPAGTPFALTVTGNDPDGDALTWCLEERDLGPATSLNSGDNGSSPLFRSFNPSVSPCRTFPQLSDILNNATTLGERLPSTSRALSFRVTARDNRTGGGGVASADMHVTVSAAAGPFRVTAPTAGVTWSGLRTVTWDVAGTTNAPINATNVDVLLSTDGGQSFPIALATNVPNTGSQLVLLPNLATASARVKVQATGNIFFDISHGNFSIAPSSADLAVSATVATTNVNAGTNLTYTLRVTNAGPGVASGVLLSNMLPVQMNFVSAVSSQGSCALSNGTLTCAMGVLTNGSTAQISLVMVPKAVGLITNTFSIMAGSVDPVTANNSTCVVINARAVHNGPTLPAQPDITISGQSVLVITNTGNDYDIPALALTYQLINPPQGVTIDTNGIITWTSLQNLGAGAYTLQTMVTDNGSPHLSATNSVRVSVESQAKSQALAVLSLSLSNGFAALTWNSESGRTYRVQYEDSISGPWRSVSPDIAATNSTSTAVYTTSGAQQRFFRVRLL